MSTKTMSESVIKVSRTKTKLKRQKVRVENFADGELTTIKVIDCYDEKDTTDFDYTWTLQALHFETIVSLNNQLSTLIKYIEKENGKG